MRGFDEYVNMVLEDVTEYEFTAGGRKEVLMAIIQLFYRTYETLLSLS